MPPHGRGKIHAPARSEQLGLPAHALFVVDGRFAVADVADAPRDVPRGRERPAIPPHARVFKAFHLIEARPGHIHGEEFGQAGRMPSVSRNVSRLARISGLREESIGNSGVYPPGST